jgi:deoxycytidine triphosphate deaminase
MLTQPVTTLPLKITGFVQLVTRKRLVSESIILFPGEVVLATTQEFLKMPRNVVCGLKLKISLGRLWLNHNLSYWINCGFSGQATLRLLNLGPYPRELVRGMRIAQLVFMGMESAPNVAYGEGGCGHYLGQSGATRPGQMTSFREWQGRRRSSCPLVESREVSWYRPLALVVELPPQAKSIAR